MEEKSNAVLRTEKRLRLAYARLLSEKNYKNITVTELCDKAEMSRAAFYLHFGSLDEFALYCKRHLICEISRQLIFWLDNREAVDSLCKRKNLLISQGDRELFGCFFEQEIYFEDSDFHSVYPYFYDYFKKRFSESYADEHIVELDFFIRAFSITSMTLFIGYNSSRTRDELGYVFLIWDRLFPDSKTDSVK